MPVRRSGFDFGLCSKAKFDDDVVQEDNLISRLVVFAVMLVICVIGSPSLP